MNEKIFKIINGKLIQIERKPNLEYRYTKHPETKENIYIELTNDELIQRQRDREEHLTRLETPIELTLEERVTILEEAIKSPRNR